MSSVWSASMSNGVSDLACHMCLSAYKLTGRGGGRVRSDRGARPDKQGSAPASGFRSAVHICTRIRPFVTVRRQAAMLSADGITQPPP